MTKEEKIQAITDLATLQASMPYRSYLALVHKGNRTPDADAARAVRARGLDAIDTAEEDGIVLERLLRPDGGVSYTVVPEGSTR